MCVCSAILKWNQLPPCPNCPFHLEIWIPRSSGATTRLGHPGSLLLPVSVLWGCWVQALCRQTQAPLSPHPLLLPHGGLRGICRFSSPSCCWFSESTFWGKVRYFSCPVSIKSQPQMLISLSHPDRNLVAFLGGGAALDAGLYSAQGCWGGGYRVSGTEGWSEPV